MELTAYIDNLEEGMLALESGADSVCAKINLDYSHFTLEEISSLSLYAHRHNKKIFVSLDFMVREEKWPKVIDIIIALNEIKPDALIIQDLGVYYLLRHKFPHFTLYASRLMNIHNVLGVRQLKKMGFKRVALACELSLREIEEIKKQVSTELEVLVHGRLHFSQQGLCLFSSFLCGKSNMEGHCQRPCDLPYEINGEIGYFFHCRPLCAISLIPQLRLIGIDAVSIEVKRDIDKVVKAYRTVIDKKEAISAIKYARSLLKGNFTTGFFISPKFKDIISVKGPEGEVYLGQVQKREGENIYFFPKEEVKVGDLVLARDNALNEIVWQIKNINKDRQFLSINAPQGVQVGCLLFRLKDKPNKVPKRRLLDKIINKEKRRNLINWIKKQRIQKKHTKAREFWIHSKTLDLFESPRFPFFPILTINERNYSHLLRRYRQILKRLPNITLSLPPIILPQQLFFFEKAINQLLSLGFKRWFIANLGQFLLFPKGEIFLGTDYTFNVANKLSMKALEELGANIITTSVELDKGSMRGLPTAMVLVYGRIPVFTSRLNLETFRGKSIISPLGMEYFILSRNQITYVLPQTPFSLINSLKELKSFGMCKFLLDLRFVLTKEGAKVLASVLPRGLDSNYKRRGLK